MNFEIKTKWLAALRSGKYRQGKNWLKSTDKDGNTCFCCLGVLCEIYNKEVGGLEVTDGAVSSYGTDTKVLPLAVKNWAGLDFSVGLDRAYFDDKEKGYKGLPELNDEDWDFNDLAHLIEEKL